MKLELKEEEVAQAIVSYLQPKFTVPMKQPVSVNFQIKKHRFAAGKATITALVDFEVDATQGQHDNDAG